MRVATRVRVCGSRECRREGSEGVWCVHTHSSGEEEGARQAVGRRRAQWGSVWSSEVCGHRRWPRVRTSLKPQFIGCTRSQSSSPSCTAHGDRVDDRYHKVSVEEDAEASAVCAAAAGARHTVRHRGDRRVHPTHRLPNPLPPPDAIPPLASCKHPRPHQVRLPDLRLPRALHSPAAPLPPVQRPPRTRRRHPAPLLPHRVLPCAAHPHQPGAAPHPPLLPLPRHRPPREGPRRRHRTACTAATQHARRRPPRLLPRHTAGEQRELGHRTGPAPRPQLPSLRLPLLPLFLLPFLLLSLIPPPRDRVPVPAPSPPLPALPRPAVPRSLARAARCAPHEVLRVRRRHAHLRRQPVRHVLHQPAGPLPPHTTQPAAGGLVRTARRMPQRLSVWESGEGGRGG